MAPAVVSDFELPSREISESAITPAAATPLFNLFSPEKKTIAITGGGRGLGITLALAVVEAGGNVACLDILEAPAAEEWSYLTKLISLKGCAVSHHKCDVTNEKAFHCRSGFDSWANFIVYLMARVLDLLAAGPTTPLDIPSRSDPTFRVNWLKLWKHISDWYDLRPAALHPIMTIPSSDKTPFPTILFSNPAGISGNQLYHTPLC